MIKQLTNEIIDLNTKHFKPFFQKKTNMDTPPLTPSTLGINWEDYGMEIFFHTHQSNHSERTFPKFINSSTTMMLLQDPPNKDKMDDEEGNNDDKQEKEVEEEEETNPLSHLNLIWDDIKIDDIDDGVLEETCVGNYYNLRSKGAPKSNDSPTTSKMVPKKNPST